MKQMMYQIREFWDYRLRCRFNPHRVKFDSDGRCIYCEKQLPGWSRP